MKCLAVIGTYWEREQNLVMNPDPRQMEVAYWYPS